ncbi:MAG: ferritin-like domain-containing protein [archaeon]
MASAKLLEMMNKGIARELQVAIQYMWQHVQWAGIEHYAVDEDLKKIGIVEMKHAEKIAERLWYLGGKRAKPTTKPDPINVGETLTEMLTFDVKAEAEAIAMYKEIIQIALQEGDQTTNRIFREILEDEEEHHDFFTSALEK